jgi:hypothetical protein
MRLIRHRSLYADMVIFATQSLGAPRSSPDFAGIWLVKPDRKPTKAHRRPLGDGLEFSVSAASVESA